MACGVHAQPRLSSREGQKTSTNPGLVLRTAELLSRAQTPLAQLPSAACSRALSGKDSWIPKGRGQRTLGAKLGCTHTCLRIWSKPSLWQLFKIPLKQLHVILFHLTFYPGKSPCSLWVAMFVPQPLYSCNFRSAAGQGPCGSESFGVGDTGRGPQYGHLFLPTLWDFSLSVTRTNTDKIL